MDLIRTGISAGNIRNCFLSDDKEYIFYVNKLFLSKYGLGAYYLKDEKGHILKSLTPYPSLEDTMIFYDSISGQCITLFDKDRQSTENNIPSAVFNGGYVSTFNERGQRIYQSQTFIPNYKAYENSNDYNYFYLTKELLPCWALHSSIKINYSNTEITLKNKETITFELGGGKKTFTAYKNPVMDSTKGVFDSEGKKICIGTQYYKIDVEYSLNGEDKKVTLQLKKDSQTKKFILIKENKFIEIPQSNDLCFINNYVIDDIPCKITFSKNLSFEYNNNNPIKAEVIHTTPSFYVKKAIVYFDKTEIDYTTILLYVCELPRWFNYE